MVIVIEAFKPDHGRPAPLALGESDGSRCQPTANHDPQFPLLAGVPVPLALGESYGSHCQPTAATRGEPMGSTDASGGAQETLTHTRLVRGQAGCTSGLQAVSRLGSCKTTAIAFDACICCHNVSMVCPPITIGVHHVRCLVHDGGSAKRWNSQSTH